MNPDSGMGIKTRILAGVGALVLLSVVVLATALMALDDSQKSQRKIFEENFGNLYDLPTLRANLNAQRLGIAMMLQTSRDEWGPWLDEINKRRATSDSILNRLILRFRNVPAESEKLGLFVAAREAYQRGQESQIELLANGGNSREAKALFIGKQMETYSRMRSIIGELELMELNEARAIVRSTEDRTAGRKRAFLILGVVGVLVAAALAAYMSRTISDYVAEVNSAEAASARAHRALKMTNSCNAIVIRATDETILLEDICRAITELGGYKMAWVGYTDDDKNKSVRPMAFAGEDGDYIEHANITWADTERGRGPTGTCIRTGEVVIARNTSTEPGYEPWRFRASEKGYKSSATLPLKDGKDVYGALMVYSGYANAFDDNEVELLKSLAGDLAFATTALREQSARRQAEKKARESAAYARSLLEASLDPLMAVSPSGKITDVNVAMEKVTGRTRGDLLGSDFADCFTDAEKARAAHREAIENEYLLNYPLTIKHVSGRGVDVVYNAGVFKNDAGEMKGVFAAARATIRQLLDP